jgi:hypothetical protein
LINLMPPHRTYIEAFLGGGAVMRLKRPADYNIGIDLDVGVIERWRSHQGESADFSGNIGVPAGTVKAPLAVRGESADPRRRRSAVSPIADPRRFRFLRGDALTFLASYPLGPDDLIYLDPPYLMETRSSGRLYNHEFSDAQHAELLSTIGGLPCRILVSGYWSEMYAEALRSWTSIHFEAMTRGGMATEWVWFNFEPPTVLHDYRYLGDDFRKRQDLKRQVASWTRKLRDMPTLKRQALLSAVASLGNGDDTTRSVDY